MPRTRPRAQDFGKLDQILRLLLDLRREFREHCNKGEVPPPSRPVASDWRQRKWEIVYAAIDDNIATASFTAALLVAIMSERSEGAKRLQDAVRKVLSKPRLTTRRLALDLLSAPSRAGPWRLQIDQEHTNAGRSYCVVRVTEE